MESKSKFLTPAEVVQRWSNAVTVGTLANWRSKKSGPPYQKRGSRVLYPADQLEKWEAANQHMASVPETKNEAA